MNLADISDILCGTNILSKCVTGKNNTQAGIDSFRDESQEMVTEEHLVLCRILEILK